MKLNKLFLLLAVAGTLFTACEPTTTQEPEQPEQPEQPTENTGALNVIDKQVIAPFYASEGVINYTITDGVEGVKPSVSANYEWVNNFVVAETITFNVDFNPTAEGRIATVFVTLGEQKFEVFVRQDAGWAVDVEFTATALNGEYYGKKYSPDYNYFAILSKNGTTGWSDLYIDTYYRFDIYTKSAAGDVLTLPQGIYTFDYYSQGNGETFGNEYSVIIETFENGQLTETYFQDGVIIVTENKIEAYLATVNNKVHRVVYEGSLELGYLEFPEPEYYSTLTSDLTINETGADLRLVNYGDFYGVGANNWSVSMIESNGMNGPYFMLDIVTDNTNNNVDSILGTYSVATNDTIAKSTFLAGYLDGTQYAGCWYLNVADGYVDHGNRAPLTSGTITIAKEGSNYVVTYDCVDDNGHKVTGTYSCGTVTDYSGQQ